MPKLARFLVAALAAAGAGAAAAAPCAGFSDVDDTSPFCPNVAWLKNRGITTGCTSSTYCPSAPVTRLAMAAFMNRLGAALTPQHLVVETTLGAVALDQAPIVCQTQSYAVSAFPRRAVVDLAFAGQAPSSVDVAADLVMNVNNAASWIQLTSLPSRGFLAAGQWGNVANLAVRDLDVGPSVKFGVRVSRVAGIGDLSAARCNLRVTIGSRDGAVPPY